MNIYNIIKRKELAMIFVLVILMLLYKLNTKPKCNCDKNKCSENQKTIRNLEPTFFRSLISLPSISK